MIDRSKKTPYEQSIVNRIRRASGQLASVERIVFDKDYKATIGRLNAVLTSVKSIYAEVLIHYIEEFQEEESDDSIEKIEEIIEMILKKFH